MRQALTYVLVAALSCTAIAAAERKSWSRIRYVGGTVPVKTSPYDWNTTLTVSANPDMIVVVIAPAVGFSPRLTLRIKPAQVVSLSAGTAAWKKVGETTGAQLPSKPPPLFGLLQDNGFLGLAWRTDDGKPAAVLLDSYFSARILQVLKAITGKAVEELP